MFKDFTECGARCEKNVGDAQLIFNKPTSVKLNNNNNLVW